MSCSQNPQLSLQPGARMASSSRYSFPSQPVANPKAIVTGGGSGSYYRFTVLTSRLLRYEWSGDGGFEDRVSTVAFWRDFDVPSFTAIDSGKDLEIRTEYFKLSYDKKKFSGGLSVKAGKDVWHYDGNSYGDLGGTARTLDGANGRIPIEPGVLSRNKAYAVLDDSKSMLFENGWIAVRQPGRIDGYFFAYHGNHKAAIRDFYRLSGRQPILPRWTLGNWWSRYHAYSASEYIELLNNFEKASVPLSVGVLDMDWHKVDIPSQYGSGWTGYSWNRELFPDPEGHVKEMHRRGLKVTLNDHPADGVRAFEDLYEDVAKAYHLDPSKGEPVRFDCTDKRFLDVYFDVLKAKLEKQGIDFWWIDWQQGNRSRIPGVDPLWVLNHYHYLTSIRNLDTNEKPITFSRYAGPGSHRYPIGFSGDAHITWASLQFQPEFTATASNIGYGWWSHDIGGHMWGIRSGQLTARWVQLGCFSPILRLHSEKSQWTSREPWLYEPEARDSMEKYLRLRHRLIPYLYTMNIRASYEDEPLIQPMYWNHNDNAAYSMPNQYYFGPDLIVSPITKPQSTTTLLAGVIAWLPAASGRYIDILHPSLVYDGNRHIRIHRPLSDIPVFAKEGTILVLDSTPTLRNGVHRPTEVEIQLVVGADAHFELVEEPEKEQSSVHPPLSSFVRTPITWRQSDGRLTIGPVWNGTGKWRQWSVKLIGYTNSNVTATTTSDSSSFQPVVDTVNHTTTINLGAVERWTHHTNNSFEIYLGNDLQLDITDIKTRLHEMLMRCEMYHPSKEDIWQIVTEDEGSVEERVGKLLALDIDDALKDAVMEIWAADGRAPGTAAGFEKWSEKEDAVVEAGTREGVDAEGDSYVMV
ncbi:glycoside hydrolase family 31 protein [Cercophora newfieldiana]|uniref:alpha-glucosidase n=1 Tax=Cercophora newfieldiana TaxID=92897 RepID=A0AA40CKQ3_9PEZI|nr:glycoside hydrolase family 31 protein [Cercophora newfieldiana]